MSDSLDPSDYLVSESEMETFEQKVQERKRPDKRVPSYIKRAHKVKTRDQYNTLMRLYVRTGNVWSTNFMEKIADKTGLTTA